jgi:hypothetical protein
VSVLRVARDIARVSDRLLISGIFEPASLEYARCAGTQWETDTEKRLAEWEANRASFVALEAYEERVRLGIGTEDGRVPTPQRKRGRRDSSTLPTLPSDMA